MNQSQSAVSETATHMRSQHMRSQHMRSQHMDMHMRNPSPLRRSISVAGGCTEDGADAIPNPSAAVASLPHQAGCPPIRVPPMQYHLLHASVERVCSHIDELTKFDLASPAYLTDLKRMMYAHHQTKPIVFGYIPAPPNERITKQVIGTAGYYLKMTTTLCEVYFIWHDMDSNTFLFWAPSTYKIVKAMNSIRWRIVKCVEMWKTNEQAIEEPGQAIEEPEPEPSSQAIEAISQRASRPTSARKRSDRSPAPEPESDDDDMSELISCGNTPDYEHPEPF